MQFSMSHEVNEIHSAITSSENSPQCTELAQSSCGPARYNTLCSNLLMRTLLDFDLQLYNGFSNPQNHPTLGLLASAFTMPEHLCRSGADEFTCYLRHKAIDTAEILRLLSKTVDSFDILHQLAPALRREWIQCQQDLHQYMVAIEEGGFQRFSAAFFSNSSSTTQSPMLPEDASSCSWSSHTDLPDWLIISNLSGFLAFNDFESNAPDVLYTHDDWENVTQGKRTEEATRMALIGWIYYGQVLASSFSVYVRVFVRLLQMGN